MKTFTEFLNEGRGFEWDGSKYSSGFGRYTKDGKSISKEEYMKASTDYKKEKEFRSHQEDNVFSDEFAQNMKIKNYKPTKKDLKDRLSEPEVKVTKDGTIDINIPVKMGYDGNLSDGKGIKITPEHYWKKHAWKQYKAKVVDKDGNKPSIGGFKMFVKHDIAPYMENEWMRSAVMTDKEKENIINDTLTAMFDYIDKNYEDISKSEE